MSREGADMSEPIELDLSELAGRTYTCMDGCALCCLCQPELLTDEERRFRQDPALGEGVADRHISPDVSGAALRLRGSHGSCWFLKDKRCRIYNDRPHFCRLFPVNVFVGWRIQLNVNLSCRGIGLPGEDLTALGKGILAAYGDARLGRELTEARNVFSEFVRNTRRAGVSQPFTSLRTAGADLMDELTDPVGISRLLTYAEHGSTKQNASSQDIVRHARRTEAEADIEEAAVISGTELFDLPDLSLLPVYVDDDLDWKIFRLVGNEIVGYHLAEDGGTREFCRVDPSAVELLPMGPDARKAAKDYLSVVNLRDCFMGHAAYLCDMEGYDYSLAQVYTGALASNALDLWWRASFLAGLRGGTGLSVADIKNGVVFFDMDLLDLPTIGAFI